MARKERILPLLALLASFAVALESSGCQGSNSVTGPATGTAAVNIAGAWSGSFQSDDAMSCSSSGAVASFEQVGSNVTGNLTTSTCGVAGYFKATLAGNTLTGSVSMDGCIGGQFSGVVGPSGILLSIGDMTKPLITGDRVVFSGGVVTLRR